MSNYFVNGVKDEANIREFDTLDAPVRELILAAVEARKHAYCPYSNFAVGAAIRTSDGSIYTGCNIENGAYTAGICAERTAAAKAISEGKRDFVACAVVAQQEGSFTTPCGVCRQFLAEFGVKKDFPLYAAKPLSPPFRVLCTSIMELLPKTFLLEK
ncbi:cytidine deaminase [Musca autumnalis]|uniref:cytidine deaminase n=1 Tax=Musca autumnalis TaxID=221902 RepID=UPI003CF2EA96